MSQSIASKNLYELLGNDPELDPERATPKEPVKTVDKPTPRAGKRNAPAEAPSSRSTGSSEVRSTPGNTRSGNENAFRDRGVGADKNRSRGSGDPGEHGERPRGELGRGRGTRRGAGRGRTAMGGDRHSRSGIAEHEKQAAHGWGAETGEAELADEKAGEAIAKEDEKEEGAVAAADEVEPEPEEKTKSYDAYLAELAEKKLKLEAQNVRKANEGSSAKFPEGKPIEREEEEAYIAGSGGKAKRERERKQKEFIELDGTKLRQTEQRDSGFRGGRGGRGRGEFRGGEGRGRGGRGRGEFRGGEGRGRGEARGGRGGARGGQSGPNLADTNAFPSLGA